MLCGFGAVSFLLVLTSGERSGRDLPPRGHEEEISHQLQNPIPKGVEWFHPTVRELSDGGVLHDGVHNIKTAADLMRDLSGNVVDALHEHEDVAKEGRQHLDEGTRLSDALGDKVLTQLILRDNARMKSLYDVQQGKLPQEDDPYDKMLDDHNNTASLTIANRTHLKDHHKHRKHAHESFGDAGDLETDTDSTMDSRSQMTESDEGSRPAPDHRTHNISVEPSGHQVRKREAPTEDRSDSQEENSDTNSASEPETIDPYDLKLKDVSAEKLQDLAEHHANDYYHRGPLAKAGSVGKSLAKAKHAMRRMGQWARDGHHIEAAWDFHHHPWDYHHYPGWR